MSIEDYLREGLENKTLKDEVNELKEKLERLSQQNNQTHAPDPLPPSISTHSPSNDGKKVHANGREAKTFEEWNELRRKDKRRYFSPEVQRKVMSNAELLGDDFYKKKTKDPWE